MKYSKWYYAFLTLVIVGGLIPISCGDDNAAAGTGLSQSEVLALIDNSLNTQDRNLTLWNIQPGLGTVMIEFTTRFNNAWFAAQAGNWRMAAYQIKELTEIQEVGETTRPGRAPALKAFEAAFITPLNTAIAANNLAQFTTAYDNAINGCNGCHATQLDGNGVNFDFVKVVRPRENAFNNLDWAGQ